MSSEGKHQLLYESSIVLFVRIMKNMLHVMDKAEKYANEKGEHVEDYVKLQLYPDMRNFAFQIQSMSMVAQLPLTLIAGRDPLPTTNPGTEQDWSELRTDLTNSIALLEGVNPIEFSDRENIPVTVMGGQFKSNALGFLQIFAVPNFYFHAVTAYDLLRMQGVTIGKRDYLAGNLGLPN